MICGPRGGGPSLLLVCRENELVKSKVYYSINIYSHFIGVV